MSDKYCINCIHFYVQDEERFDPVTLEVRKQPGNPEYGLCKLSSRPRDLVTGELPKDRQHNFCTVERIGKCGPSARLYVDKRIPVTQEEEEAFTQLENKHV